MMDSNLEVVVGVFSFLFIVSSYLLFKTRLKNKYYEEKYSRIIDIDAEVEGVKREKEILDKEIENLRVIYKDKKSIFDRLVKEAAIYDESIELAELGFYTPHYDFDVSETYKENLTAVKAKQKELISSKEAIHCNIEWRVEGSKAKGRTMINRGIKLTARAFNNECDSAISNTNWNNVERMEQRIERAFDAINKLNESNKINISCDALATD